MGSANQAPPSVHDAVDSPSPQGPDVGVERRTAAGGADDPAPTRDPGRCDGAAAGRRALDVLLPAGAVFATGHSHPAAPAAGPGRALATRDAVPRGDFTGHSRICGICTNKLPISAGTSDEEQLMDWKLINKKTDLFT
ncbi:uncharacterized protein LOC124776177 [Schistocerca piceifrons]|uniref:uncharacterized protein LOC124776177 n=1 Tax=Schistocerca piceifrons TaxID=274613 RepID=UPI001F5EE2A1|nr:uncharacterized protein LOC124776177 [Schistocerca piceifrons]